MKLGVAPFHGWLVRILMREKWELFFILSSVQKLLPMYGIFLLIRERTILNFLIAITAIAATLGSASTVLFKLLLIYFSILRVAWILFSQRVIIRFLYLILLRLNLRIICSIFRNINFTLNHMRQLINQNLILKISLFITRLRLLGVPPFLGFLGKVIIIYLNSNVLRIILLRLLIIRSITLIWFFMAPLGLLVLSQSHIFWWKINKFLGYLNFLWIIQIFGLIIFIVYRVSEHTVSFDLTKIKEI